MSIVLDIETSNYKEGVIDPEKDKLIVIGLLFENGRKEYYYQKDWYRAKFKLNRSNEAIVGHNLLGFDLPVLSRYGFDFSDKVIIDTYDILKHKRRAKAMMYADLEANGGHSLANCCKYFNLDVRKIEDFNYDVLNKTPLLPGDVEYINEYLGRDLDASRALYDHLVSVFKGIKSFMNQKDQDSYKWLTTSPGVCAYKVICHQAGLSEEYEDAPHVDYPGAYVHLPNTEEAHGSVYSFDYKSLYPHCMMMLNVFEHAKDGDDRIESVGDFTPKGSYSKSHFGRVSRVLQRMFELKDRYEQEGDKAGRLATKIVLNCFSPDTLIVAQDGVVKMEDVQVGDLVYSINPQTREVELKPVTKTVNMPYDGEMYHWSDTNKDLLVTPNHRMLCEYNGERFFSPAEDTKSYYQYVQGMPIKGRAPSLFDMKSFVPDGASWLVKLDDSYSQRKNNALKYDGNRRMHKASSILEGVEGEWSFQTRRREGLTPRYIPIEDFFYFLGIFIAEGSTYVAEERHYDNGNHRGLAFRVHISQKSVNEPTKNKIAGVLDRLGIRYSRNSSGFDICSKFWYSFLRSQVGVGSYEKCLPDWVFEYDHTVLERLHEGLYDGDGNKENYRYTTASVFLRDDMIRLNTHLGYRAKYTRDSGVWRITRNKPGKYHHPTVVNNPFDRIVCVSVEDNQTVLAGRNGRFSWTGQTVYGILGNPVFKSVANPVAAEDVTQLGQYFTRSAIRMFEGQGYRVLYGDTDSVYLQDPYQDEERLNATADAITRKLNNQAAFPQDTFSLAMEERIWDAYFFQDKDGFKKKFYLFVGLDGSMTVKGLPIKKRDRCELSKLVFSRLKPKILEKRTARFPKELIDSLITHNFKSPEQAGKVLFSKPLDEYKSKTSLQYQASKKWGPGRHVIVPVVKGDYDDLQIGKGSMYLRIQDFINLGVSLDDVRLEHVYKDLSYFIKEGDDGE